MSKLLLDKNKAVYEIEKKYSNISFASTAPSNYIIKFPLIKMPCRLSHEYIFTKHLVSFTLAGDSILHQPKLWYAIISACCQSVSTNKIWTIYKDLNEYYCDIYRLILPPSTHANLIIPN